MSVALLALAACMGLALSELVQQGRLTKRLVREVLVLFVHIDLFALRVVRRIFAPRYALEGACQRRGACCTQIVAHPPRAITNSKRLLSLFAAFHRLMHNFEVRGRGPNGELIFRCNHLRPDNRCGIWRLRPRLCRVYPLLPFFEAPKLLPGCGYRVVRRGLKPNARLPIVDAHVGTHHPTPAQREDDSALEHEEDFQLRERGPYAPTHGRHVGRGEARADFTSRA